MLKIVIRAVISALGLYFGIALSVLVIMTMIVSTFEYDDFLFIVGYVCCIAMYIMFVYDTVVLFKGYLNAKKD